MGKRDGQFYLAVAAIIENPQKKILITKRSLQRDHQPGQWELVTGRIKQDEKDMIHALKREVQEETGLSITTAIPYRTFYFERGVDKQPHFGVNFYCPYAGDERVIVDEKEQDAYEWVTPQRAIEVINDDNIKDAVRSYQEFCQHYT